jgi:hypothetical protein
MSGPSAETRAIRRAWIYQRQECDFDWEELHGERRKNFVGESFWVTGFFVSTVSLDEKVVQNYMWEPQREDEHCEACLFFIIVR